MQFQGPLLQRQAPHEVGRNCDAIRDLEHVRVVLAYPHRSAYSATTTLVGAHTCLLLVGARVLVPVLQYRLRQPARVRHNHGWWRSPCDDIGNEVRQLPQEAESRNSGLSEKTSARQ